MKRILMIGLVLALLGVMLMSSAALAEGPCGDGDGSQARQGATNQYGATYGPGDGTSPIGGGEYGATYGPGDGIGPVLKCLDLNGDGVCGRPQ
jgi:hypothetical protein